MSAGMPMTPKKDAGKHLSLGHPDEYVLQTGMKERRRLSLLQIVGKIYEALK